MPPSSSTAPKTSTAKHQAIPKQLRHKYKPRKKPIPRKPATLTDEERRARLAELSCLPEYIKAKWPSWSDKNLQEHQLKGARCQHLGEDAIVHAGTGSGKTATAAAPHALPSNAGKVTLMVSPLIALHEEQVTAFKEEFKLDAVAINSAHGDEAGCSQDKLKRIVNGDFQIVIVSPEMLQTRRFIEGVLRKPEFGARCLSVFIDEGHCVSHWGAGFRKKYGTIGTIRAHLPRSTPFIAVSATLTARVRYDLVEKLQFHPTNWHYINIGNDRPNVAQIVRAIEHPLGSYADLDFVIPPTVNNVADIPKTMIYFDDIISGASMVDYLNGRVSAKFKHLGLVRPYNAAMSRSYRKNVMRLFYAGVIRVLVCTDAAGMGCNIPDIDIVVQWKCPKTLSAWVQRAGRVARGPGRNGIAVMLVEKSAFQVDPSSVVVDSSASGGGAADGGSRGRGQGRGRGRRGRGRGRGGQVSGQNGRAEKKTQAYAVLHGLKRGSCSGQHDMVQVGTEPTLTNQSPCEGLYVFVQTNACRRAVLTKVFENVPPHVPPSQCCDLCNPLLFNRCRGGQPPKTTRQRAIKRHAPDPVARLALYGWRRAMKKKYFSSALWAPHGLLDNETCEIISSVLPLPNKNSLEKLLTGWDRWTHLGDELYSFLVALPPPAKAPVTTTFNTAPLPPVAPSSTIPGVDGFAHTPSTTVAADRATILEPTVASLDVTASQPPKRRLTENEEPSTHKQKRTRTSLPDHLTDVPSSISNTVTAQPNTATVVASDSDPHTQPGGMSGPYAYSSQAGANYAHSWTYYPPPYAYYPQPYNPHPQHYTYYPHPHPYPSQYTQPHMSSLRDDDHLQAPSHTNHAPTMGHPHPTAGPQPQSQPWPPHSQSSPPS